MIMSVEYKIFIIIVPASQPRLPNARHDKLELAFIIFGVIFFINKIVIYIYIYIVLAVVLAAVRPV